MTALDSSLSVCAGVLLLSVSFSIFSTERPAIWFDTIKDNNQFSDPDPSLTGDAVGDFQLGNALFRKLWSINSSSVKSADGVGPLFNSRSCQRCHLKDGRGNPPADEQSFSPSLVFQLAVQQRVYDDQLVTLKDKNYGQQIQPFAANGLHGEANIFVKFSQQKFVYPDGQALMLNRPSYRIENLAYGELDKQSVLAPRVAPPMVGLGLLQSIPATDVKANADPEDKNNDGISGRANFGYSLEYQRTMLGRFGWKASAPSIIDQAAVAFSVDMGLSTPLINVNYGDCTARQVECLRVARFHTKQSQSSDPEVSRDVLELVAHYSENLAVPAARNTDSPDFNIGKALFKKIKCGACHTPQHVSGSGAEVTPHLRGRVVDAYTDLLLHDMGPELSDTQRRGFAFANEWRTTPLWGIGLTQTVNAQARFLHDGRAASIEEAIIWHSGEAEQSKLAFAQLKQKQREAILFFLSSL